MDLHDGRNEERMAPDPTAPWHISYRGIFLCVDREGYYRIQANLWKKIVAGMDKLTKGRCLNASEAKDLASTAFENIGNMLMKKGIQLDREDGFEGYVYRSAKHLFLKLDSKSKKEKSQGRSLAFSEFTHALGPFERPGCTHQWERELTEELCSFFRDKPVILDIMTSHAMHGENLCDIAGRLGILDATVRKKFERARKDFLHHLKGVRSDSELGWKLKATRRSRLEKTPQHIPSICYRVVNDHGMHESSSFQKFDIRIDKQPAHESPFFVMHGKDDEMTLQKWARGVRKHGSKWRQESRVWRQDGVGTGASGRIPDSRIPLDKYVFHMIDIKSLAA